MNRRMLRRFLLLLAVLTLFCSGQAFAAKKNKWVKKNGYWYYYNSEGKKSKGLTVIGKKTYYFDDTGKQRVGWRKIGDTYYKFRQKGKTGAYMYTSIKQEGITLGKRGRAKLTTLKKKTESEASGRLCALGGYVFQDVDDKKAEAECHPEAAEKV